MKEKKKVLLILGILIAVISVVGISYAVWQLTLTQTGTNVVTSGCFKVEFTDQNPITLTNAYPMSDDDGRILTPYTFTIKNECQEKASYVINLETVSSGEKILSDEYIKANLKSGEESLFSNTLKSEFENVEKVIETATKAYKLTSGILNKEEEKTFDLRLWMDEGTGPIEEVMNANWQGKITVSSSYVMPIKNLMVAMSVNEQDYGSRAEIVNDVYTQNGKYSLEKVVFQDKKNPYSTAIEVIDFSVEQDKSVMGYYVTEEQGLVLYIQANGKIRVNPIASYYGVIDSECSGSCWSPTMSSGTIEGIENLDTSEVIDMSYMFAYSLNNALDIKNFDTRNVTNMSNMFYMNNLESLDLSSFDTSNVTDMRNMFSGASNLTNIVYGNKFIYKESTDVSNMYLNCPANKPTHSSWNGVTW